MAWCLAPVVFGALALLAGCARLPVPEATAPRDRFASAYVELLPVADMMGEAAARDPRWPLAEKAALVSPAQLGCMRQVLAPGQVQAAQRQLALDYADAHPATLTADIAVLEGGAARLIGQAMRAGAGLKAPAPTRPASEGEMRALAQFATDARFAELRQATGLSRLAGGSPRADDASGKDIARALTVNFLTDAFLRCHIPVKLLY